MNNKNNTSYPIDMIVYWVDGNDAKWQAEKRKYEKTRSECERNLEEIRYRDWGCLKYLFRGISKYASWVNKVYFVTCGQIPKWLKTDCEKLVIVNHNDYIPHKYLPTFSSRAIELNFHRIEGLSDHFIIVNDDFFFTNYVARSDFFINGKPVDMFVEYPIMCGGHGGASFGHTLVNNFNLIADYISRDQYKKIFTEKILNPRYGMYFFYNLIQYIIPYPKFFGVLTPHIAMPYLKESFNEIWDNEYELLNKTCMNKFRSETDVNIYVVRLWNLLKGNFVPRNVLAEGKNMQISNNPAIFSAIEKNKYKRICLNDAKCSESEYIQIKKRLQNSFEKILPEKSIYEM